MPYIYKRRLIPEVFRYDMEMGDAGKLRLMQIQKIITSFSMKRIADESNGRYLFRVKMRLKGLRYERTRYNHGYFRLRYAVRYVHRPRGPVCHCEDVICAIENLSLPRECLRIPVPAARLTLVLGDRRIHLHE